MKIEFVVVFGLIAFFFVAALFDDEPQQTNDLYCEMVEIHKDTGGEYGWPDYRNDYDEACK